jgi:hypothetical protein
LLNHSTQLPQLIKQHELGLLLLPIFLKVIVSKSLKSVFKHLRYLLIKQHELVPCPKVLALIRLELI